MKYAAESVCKYAVQSSVSLKKGTELHIGIGKK